MAWLRNAIGGVVLAGGLLCRAEPASFRVSVDVTRAPDAKPYAEVLKALCEQWYPRINAILFGADDPLPFQEVRIVFEPTLQKCDAAGCVEAGGFADKDTIQINFGAIVRMKDDYRAMFIHELTHINQQNKDAPGTGWLVEGMADFVRHRYFEKDLEPKLQELDGYHFGGSEADNQARLRTQGYLFGYTVAAPFLYWLELRKSSDLPVALNKALRQGSYSPDLFEKYCGAPLDALWREFVLQNGAGR